MSAPARLHRRPAAQSTSYLTNAQDSLAKREAEAMAKAAEVSSLKVCARPLRVRASPVVSGTVGRGLRWGRRRRGPHVRPPNAQSVTCCLKGAAGVVLNAVQCERVCRGSVPRRASLGTSGAIGGGGGDPDPTPFAP